MALIQALALCGLLAMVHSYPDGPPIDTHPDLCVHMTPTGHNVTTKEDAAPYEIIVDKSCYRSGDTLQVEVKNNDDLDFEKFFFEGFFLQARPAKDSDYEATSIGTFENSHNDAHLKTLDCFSKPQSAMSHAEAHHYASKNFSWVAPNVTDAFVFHATIVRETEEIWMNVRSSVITHCDAPPTKAPTKAPASASDRAFASVMVISIISLFTAFFNM